MTTKKTNMFHISLFTLTMRSREKMNRQRISMLSVRPQGGSHGGGRCRRSEVDDKDDGRSTKASSSKTAMVRPRPLKQDR